MARLAPMLLALLAAAPAAHAEDGELGLEHWHDVPAGNRLRLSQQIANQLAELGNFVGTHVNVLSDDLLAMKFDAHRRSARIRLGTRDGELLHLELDSSWYFSAGKARVQARIQLGVGSHQVELALPDVDMVPVSVYGESGVEVRLPLFERRW